MDRKRGFEMPEQLKKVLYTAEATVEGGREGHARTSDGRLDVELSIPESMGGEGGAGTNPEQLFAAGYAACFQSALLGVARGRDLDASASRIVTNVGMGTTGTGGFGLQVSLDLHAPGISLEDARELMLKAHRRCPYSNATRGNVEVTLTIDGEPLSEGAAAVSSGTG
jgi:Ohr subfamily peroxiredoxin